MEPEIINKKSFNVVGLEIQTTASTLLADTTGLFDKAGRLDLDNQIQNRVNRNLSLAFIRNWSDTEPFSYFLGAEVTEVEQVPADCVSQNVATATYAVFDLNGSGSNISEPWPEIYAWLESSKEKWVMPMNFREYDESTEGGRIYVPIAVG